VQQALSAADAKHGKHQRAAGAEDHQYLAHRQKMRGGFEKHVLKRETGHCGDHQRGTAQIAAVREPGGQSSNPACCMAALIRALVASVSPTSGSRTSGAQRPSSDRPYLAPTRPGSMKIASCSGIRRS